MYNTRIPTGAPECPHHIREAKRIHIMIQERSDADNMEGNPPDIGVEVDREEDGVTNDEEEKEENKAARVLFQGPPRPLVRTPVCAARSQRSTNTDLAAAVASLLSQSTRNEQRTDGT
jgi:hypothetical protein